MGQADAPYNFFHTMLQGRVSPKIRAALGDLRAVLFWKDLAQTLLRPIGIGECLRRMCCRCLLRQDPNLLSTFFTCRLPED